MDKQLLIEVLQMYRDNEQSLENTLRAIDVYAQSRQADVSGSLPPDVLSILNEVMYIFSTSILFKQSSGSSFGNNS